MNNLGNSETSNCRCIFLYQYLATISATLVTVCTGMHHGWPSPSLPTLFEKDSVIPMSHAEGSWITVITTIGGPFGCISALTLADRLGRKSSLLLASPLLFATWIAIASTSSVLVLGFVRFLAGVVAGFVQSLLPMYVGEIADKNIRGLLCSCLLVSTKLGILLVNIIGIYCNIKTTALLASIVPVIHFITLYFMPESPRFYILKGRNESAIASLNKLNKTQNSQDEVLKLAAAMKVINRPSESVLKIFTIKTNRKCLGIILGLFLIQQFSGYHPITFYCLTIFTEVDGFIQGSTATIIFFLVQLVSSVIGSILVDSTGRRPLLIGSTIGIVSSLTTAAVYFYLRNKTSMDLTNLSFLPLTALLLYIMSVSIGLSIIPVLMMSEIYPINIKSGAICISNIFFAGFGTLSTKLFQICKDEFGIHVPFLVFAVCCAIGLIFIICVVPETKGKTLEEIQIKLDRSKSHATRRQDNELELNMPLNN